MQVFGINVNDIMAICIRVNHISGKPLSSADCSKAFCRCFAIGIKNGVGHTAYSGLLHTAYTGMPHTVFEENEWYLCR